VDELEARRRANEADRARALAEVERRRSFVADGHLSAGAWLASRHGIPQAEAANDARVARGLEAMPSVAAALARGAVSRAAAHALVRLREQAPDAFARDERDLLERARSLPYRELRTELDRWRDQVDAEAADREEAERLARRRFDAVTGVDGMVATEGRLDPENGAYLMTALGAKTDAWSRSLARDERTPAQRRADALGEICREWLDLADRPMVSAERPHVVVTVDLETLERRAGRRANVEGVGRRGTADVDGVGRGTAELERVGRVTADAVRRLACDADITRVVLDGRSEPLEIGRRTKVVPPSMRRALIVRDGGCTFPGCERPPAWADAHHVIHWADGGETGLSNLALLCRPHHRLIHAGRFSVAIEAGRPVFRRPDGSLLEHRGPPVAA
jgi:hypothetical protein